MVLSIGQKGLLKIKLFFHIFGCLQSANPSLDVEDRLTEIFKSIKLCKKCSLHYPHLMIHPLEWVQFTQGKIHARMSMVMWESKPW